MQVSSVNLIHWRTLSPLVGKASLTLSKVLKQDCKNEVSQSKYVFGVCVLCFTGMTNAQLSNLEVCTVMQFFTQQITTVKTRLSLNVGLLQEPTDCWLFF